MSDTRTKPANALALRDPVSLPAGITLAVEPSAGGGYREASGDRGVLVLTRRRTHPVDVPTLLFGVGWTLLCGGMFVAMLVAGDRKLGILAVLGVCALTGFTVLHSALIDTFNRVVITVGGGRIAIRHGPIPAFSDFTVSARDVKQMFVRRNMGTEGPDVFSVLVHRHSAPTLPLIEGLPTLEQAQFIERTIEEHLRITDVPVAGEEPKR